MRRRLIVANWKMNKTATEARALVARLTQLVPATEPVDAVLAPPFTALAAAAQALPAGSPFALGAQDLFWEDTGAYTGEVSAPMLTDLGCRYVILGHSERRKLFSETDAHVNKKIGAALRHGLRPIVCVGESLVERDSGQAETVVTGQLNGCLSGLSKDDALQLTLAYEPVWAIGTGRAATPEQAEAMHRMLRERLTVGWSGEVAQRVRILYGGSVTPDNIGGFFLVPDVDGALVGGACLDAQAFASILRIARTERA